MKLTAEIARRLPLERRQAAQRVYHRVKQPPWAYYADGLATMHHSPFYDDHAWSAAYDRMAADWTPSEAVDARWRMWILTCYARQALPVAGDFAEFGTYRGGCAYMILSTCDLAGRSLHLFDTFAGIPDTNLTGDEREHGMGGRLADTSPDYVRRLLSRWEPVPVLHPGDVFDTVPADIGKLAFAHIDLNAAAPTLHTLKYTYTRLHAGGVVVFDDYGWQGYEDQRAVIDEFMSSRPETLIALPTGQAVFAKI
jgi:O-methyltransferase